MWSKLKPKPVCQCYAPHVWFYLATLHIHTDRHTQPDSHTPPDSLSLSLSHTRTHIHACYAITHPHTHSHMHTQAHTHTQTHARTHAHTHSHMHACMHAHTHTHTHTDLLKYGPMQLQKSCFPLKWPYFIVHLHGNFPLCKYCRWKTIPYNWYITLFEPCMLAGLINQLEACILGS